MSTYWAASEISLLLPAPATIGASTPVINWGELASAIFRTGAELDAAAAGAGYAVSISPSYPAAYAQMQKYTELGVLAWALGKIAPNVPGRGDKITLAGEYRNEYMEVLKRLREGKEILVGAPIDQGETARQLARSFETSNPGATQGRATPFLSMHDVF